MNLLYDLAQTLLIPLGRWDLGAFGVEATVPVSPLLLIVGMLLTGRLLRVLVRNLGAAVHTSPLEDEAWDEPAPRLSVAEGRGAPA